MRAPEHTPLIGRTAELDAIAAALGDRAATGVVLVGEGGVGKTRLARRALRVAEEAGFATASVLATAAAATIPLGALEPILGDLDGGGSVGALRAARQHLSAIAAGAPLVLLVDDAHLLDAASATVVLQLAGDANVFLLVNVRSGEAVPDPIVGLWKDGGARRIDLAPLGADATAQLIDALAGGPVALPARARLAEVSAGLPLALGELVEATRQSGALVERDGVWHLDGDLALSPRLADLIELRLSGLDEAGRDALATVALGEPLPLAVAAELIGHDVLASLEIRRLVELPPGGDEVTVAHPLYGEVAVRSRGELGRRQLLSALADATERVLPASGSTTLRLAIWRLAADAATDPELLLAGARTAYLASDHATMAALAGAAWERSPSAAAGHLHGLALGRLGRPDEAERSLAAATTLAGDDRMRVLVALARSENLFRGGNVADGALGCLTDAEQAVRDTVWRGELVAHRAMLVLQRGSVGDALALVEPLLAHDTPDRPFVKAAYAAGPALALAGRTEKATLLAQRALPIHERVWTEDVFQTEPAVHHVTALLALIESGQLLEAEGYAALAVQVAAEGAESYGLAYMSMLAGLVALRRGRVQTALRHCLEAAPLFDRSGYPSPRRWVSAGAATALALAGSLDEARAQLAVADDLADATPVRFNEGVVDEARGWVHVAAGELAAARECFADGAARARGRGEDAVAAHLLHTLGRLGDPVGAAAGLADLAGAVDGALFEVRVDHVEALAAGDGAGLDRVAERFSAIGADLWAAEAAAEAVRCHQRGGDQRAATRAGRLAAEHLERCDGARTPATVVTDAVEPLTDREREIALLAAEGLSSKEIARRLVLSRRTVDNHLQRVFAKVGISRRADLAEALGLPPF